MPDLSTSPELAVWSVPELEFAIEYDPAVLEEIRRLVVDGFFVMPRGGAEVGGILFGTRRDGTVRIREYRPLACEHAFGPSFVLSEPDHARLADLMKMPAHDAALSGLIPVGWYHSHTRSEIYLSERDLEIHGRHFPEPWHIMLVLRPHYLDPTRAGFFFREPSGRIRTEASYREFVLNGSTPQPSDERPQAGTPARSRLHPRAPDASGPAAMPVQPATTRLPLPAPDPPAGSGPAIAPDAELQAIAPPGEPASSPPPEPVIAPSAEASAGGGVEPAAASETEPPGVPTFRVTDSKTRPVVWVLACLMGFAGAGIAAYETRDQWMIYLPKPRPSVLALTAVDRDGQLVIRWDHDSRAVTGAVSGTLEISDGESTASVLLAPDRLRAGSFTYARQSSKVDVRLTLEQASGTPAMQETASFLGLPPSQPALPLDDQTHRERDKLAAEVTVLRQRNRQLERAIEDLRSQLRRERGRQQPAR